MRRRRAGNFAACIVTPDSLGAAIMLQGNKTMRFLRAIFQMFGVLGQFVINFGVKMPLNLFEWATTKIFGNGRLNPANWSNQPRQNAESVAASALEAVQKRQIQKAAAKEGAKIPSYGDVVHGYASAAKEMRPLVELSSLPQHIKRWLLTVNDTDLKRLAAAGPTACQRAASGKKCGVVGLHLPPTFGAVAAGDMGLLSKPAEAYAYKPKGVSKRFENLRERIAYNLIRAV
jgi:hypothetical protein